MKSTIKRITAIILCLILAFSLLTPVSAATVTAPSSTTDLPIIHVIGKLKTIYNKKGQVIYPLKKSVVNCIKDNQDAIISDATLGVLWGNWSPLKSKLNSIISPQFSELVLDTNGEISNGSYTKPYTTPVKKTNNYKLNDYLFMYDWRLDPISLASDLDKYIDSVLKATGKTKVHLVARCLGTAIAASYLTYYGADKIDSCVLYSGSAMGIIPASCFFSGNLRLEAESLERYAKNADDDVEYIEVIKMFSSLLKSSTIIKNITNRNFKEGVNAVLPDLLLKTYATMPGYWSMVSDEYYEQAKSFVFSGQLLYKYSGLIEKIDNYHYNVQQQFPAVLKSLQNGGLKVAIFAKYGEEMAPIFENSDYQSDDTIELDKQAFGATAARYNKTLSSDYIANAKKNGFGDNISADSIVDASTGYFPECTWYIKDASHETWPISLYDFIVSEVLSSKKQYTIHTNKNYPQFLQYNAYTGELVKLASKYSVQAVKLNQTVYTYTGNVITPKPFIINNAGKKLFENVDYSITYSGTRKAVGTYKMNIVYSGEYADRKPDTLTFDIVPAKLTGLTSTSTDTSVKLYWDKNSSADGYIVYSYDAAKKTYTAIKTVTNQATTSCTISGLKPLTSYMHAVKAYKTVNGRKLISQSYASIITVTLPAAPTTKITASAKSATVSWNKIAGAQGYQVYMSTLEDEGFKKVATTTNTSYVKTGLKKGTSYYFKVRAYAKVNGTTIYGKFSPVNMTEGTYKPATPTVSVTPSSRSAKLTWKSIPGASKYVIYKSTSKNGKYEQVGTTKNTSYNVTSLKAGKTYYFKVRAYANVNSKNYYSSYSSVKSAKITNTPAKPTSLKATAQSKAAKLTWSAVPGASKYEVYMSSSKNGTYKKIKTTSSCEFTKSGLKSGKTYYFKVRAYSTVSKKTYYGAYSSIVSAKAK